MASKLRVLCSGLEPFAYEILRKHLDGAIFNHVANLQEFENVLETLNDAATDLIVCGPVIPELQPSELAQAFRTQAPNVSLFFTPCHQSEIDFKLLTKNGFEDVFVLPADEALLGQALRQVERTRLGTATRVVYRSVPVMDFEPDTEVNFSVSIFLPMNKKHVKILKQGARIEQAQIEKFKKFSVTSLCIEEAELSKFISYSAVQLKKQNRDAGSSLAGRQKLQSTVRELFRTLTSPAGGDFDDGKSLLENSQKIVSEFVSAKPAQDLYEKLMAGHDASDESVYAHCGRVSTIAALLSMGTQIGTPQDLAIAGLFHDLGKIRLPAELLAKPFEKMNSDEKNQFMRFPEESLNALQEKKMGINAKVRNIILQQCERIDGQGFPKQLREHKIEPEAQLLALADRLDTELMPREGERPPNIEDALKKVEERGGISLTIFSAVRALLFSGNKAVSN